MDKIRNSSFKFKVYEDCLFKLEKQRQAIHLDDIILAKKQSTDSLTNFKDAPEAKSNNFDFGVGGVMKNLGDGGFFEDEKVPAINKHQLSMNKHDSFKHLDAIDYYSTGNHHEKMRKMASKHIDEVD